jgi:methylated-DNA-[protein]-cysteine S-methyltransferase
LGSTGLVLRDGKLAALFADVEPERFPHAVEVTFGTPGRMADRSFQEIIRQLDEYFSGARLIFRTPLDLEQGTPFQRRVWRSLLEIPYGDTVTYKDLARAIGQPSALRAVGSAVGANPVPVLVPCHRVVATGGKLGGFSAGTQLKKKLLNLETATRLRMASFGMLGGDHPGLRPS